MFNAPGVARGLSFTKVIGGLSKTLQIANQVIPLYQKAKPMIHNARSMMGILKEFKKSNPKTIEAKEAVVVNTTAKPKNSITTKKEESTSPTFFL